MKHKRSRVYQTSTIQIYEKGGETPVATITVPCGNWWSARFPLSIESSEAKILDYFNIGMLALLGNRLLNKDGSVGTAWDEVPYWLRALRKKPRSRKNKDWLRRCATYLNYLDPFFQEHREFIAFPDSK